MDQFDSARIRAAKVEAKRVRYQPLSEESQRLRSADPTLENFPLSEITRAVDVVHKVKPPKALAKRTNEISMRVYVDGEQLDYTIRVNFNDIIASQRTRSNLKEIFAGMFRRVFGKVDIQ